MKPSDLDILFSTLFSVKTTDFFDANIMERVQHQLLLFSQKTKMGLAPSDASPGDEAGKPQAATSFSQSEIAHAASSVTFRSSVSTSLCLLTSVFILSSRWPAPDARARNDLCLSAVGTPVL